MKKRKGSLINLRNKIAAMHIYEFYQSIIKLASLDISQKWIEKEGDLLRNFIKWFGLKWSKEVKYFYCSKCKKIMLPNLRVRLRNNRFKHISITCPNCGSHKRIRLSKK